MLPYADERLVRWNDTLRTALSTGLTATEARSLIDSIDADLARLRADVEAPEPFSFTIGRTATDIPLRIGNSGPTPLRVRVHAESDKLSFPEGDIEEVLAPEQITVVTIPVAARSNGRFPVSIEILTPAGNPVTESIELTARVSTLTGLGRVFTVGALLVLATWWYSYFRRRRIGRRTRALDGAHDRHPSATS